MEDVVLLKALSDLANAFRGSEFSQGVPIDLRYTGIADRQNQVYTVEKIVTGVAASNMTCDIQDFKFHRGSLIRTIRGWTRITDNVGLIRPIMGAGTMTFADLGTSIGWFKSVPLLSSPDTVNINKFANDNGSDRFLSWNVDFDEGIQIELLSNLLVTTNVEFTALSVATDLMLTHIDFFFR